MKKINRWSIYLLENSLPLSCIHPHDEVHFFSVCKSSMGIFFIKQPDYRLSLTGIHI